MPTPMIWSTKKKNNAASATIANTSPVVTSVSLRDGQVTGLDPDQLGQARYAHPGQAHGPEVVSVFRGAAQKPAPGQLHQPFPGDGKADIQFHLIADKHASISPARRRQKAGT